MAFDWLQTLGPTILTLLGGGVGWFLRDRIEAGRAAEERMRQERVKAYSEILDPILAPFTDPGGERSARGLQQMASPDYRRHAFQLALVGSDQVVHSFNEFLQLLYRSEDQTQFGLAKGLRALGKLLLEVRKSIGNRGTDLSEKDMLRWLIKDIDAHL